MPVTKVVILNWNGSAHLRTFLPSVIRTTPSDIGIVVADNGSTDDSRNVIRLEFPSVELLELDANYGFAGGYNRALSRIEADYFILLNSDVATTEGWCEPLVAALDADPRLGAVQPKMRSWLRPDYFEYAGACGGFLDRLGYPFGVGYESRSKHFGQDHQVGIRTGNPLLDAPEVGAPILPRHIELTQSHSHTNTLLVR